MCIDLLLDAREICRELCGELGEGEHHDACDEAWRLYLHCERARKRRASDTRADDRLRALAALLAEAHEKLFPIDIPPRPCGRASAKLREKILSNEKNAMIFSNKMAEAFKEASVELDDGQTYMCLVCAVEKPRFTSDAVALDPLLVARQAGPRFNYIMEPTIMKSVMNHITRDEIKY